nr:MAG TPA: hypothetical protein [Caudoviricetes sp.]
MRKNIAPFFLSVYQLSPIVLSYKHRKVLCLILGKEMFLC